eukprot:2151-Rhodomonas_salina.1
MPKHSCVCARDAECCAGDARIWADTSASREDERAVIKAFVNNGKRLCVPTSSLSLVAPSAESVPDTA